MPRSDIYCSRAPVKPRLRDSNAACFESSGSRTRQDRRRERNRVSGIRRQLDVPYAWKYKEKSKYPLAVREVRRQEPTNSHQWKGVHPHGKEFLERHYGAKFVVRIECELYPNCPWYIPNLTEKTSSSHVPRRDEAPPPPPEWKRRDYIREILPRDDPHRKEVWTRGPEES